MTNEELVRRYYGGDERALEELYRRNLGLIRRIARETAREFNCLHMDRERPGELSGYVPHDEGVRRGKGKGACCHKAEKSLSG